MERHTRQRQAVLDALARTGQALSPSEILALSQQAVPSLNLSTVYRQIKALQDQAEVVRVDLPGHPARFEVCCRHTEEHRGPAGHPTGSAHAPQSLHGAHDSLADHAQIHTDTHTHTHSHGHTHSAEHHAPGGEAEHPTLAHSRGPVAAHHHHHFHCVVCERVFTLHNCTAAMDSMTPPGFELQRHDLTLHGRCQACVVQANAGLSSAGGGA